MDEKVIQLVRDYIMNHLDKSDETPQFDVYRLEVQDASELEVSACKHPARRHVLRGLTCNGDKKE